MSKCRSSSGWLHDRRWTTTARFPGREALEPMSAAPAVGVLVELAVVDLCVVFERLDASRVASVVDPTGDGALIEAVCRVRDRDRVLQSVGKVARAARAGLHRYQTVMTQARPKRWSRYPDQGSPHGSDRCTSRRDAQGAILVVVWGRARGAMALW